MPLTQTNMHLRKVKIVPSSNIKYVPSFSNNLHCKLDNKKLII